MCRDYYIRPHHMLCLQFFEGKGYDDEFIKNMTDIKIRLESENPIVNIVSGADMICDDCPNRRGEKCRNEESVVEHDMRVYEQVIELVGNRASWQKITDAVYSNIIDSDKMKSICGECQWAEICFKHSS